MRSWIFLVVVFLSSILLPAQTVAELLTQSGNQGLVVTAVVPRMDAAEPHLSIGGLNFGPETRVYLGSIGGSVDLLPMLFSSEDYLEALLPDTLPGSYLLLVTSGDPMDEQPDQLFSLYVAIPALPLVAEPGGGDVPGSGRPDLDRSAAVSSFNLQPVNSAAANDRGSGNGVGPTSFFSAVDSKAGASPWLTNGSNIYYNAGRVGIGTSTPATLLHILGSGAEFRLASSAPSPFSLWDASSATAVMSKKSAAGSALLDIDPEPLDGSGPARFRFFRRTSTSGAVTFQVFRGDGTGTVNAQLGGNRDSFLAVTAGRVGIGTSTPTEKLHVVGNIRLSGNIKADGAICIGSGC